MLLAALALAGCGTRGDQDALFKLPPKARVLVFVDARPSSDAPLDVAPALGDAIMAHLYKYNVSEHLVGQARLVELRKAPNFARMGVGDVALRTDADVVLYVDLVAFKAEAISEGQLSEGLAQALVKVIDRRGKRLWPPETDTLGAPVEARLDATLIEQQPVNEVHKKLIAMLANRVGRMFHAYSLDDKEVAR